MKKFQIDNILTITELRSELELKEATAVQAKLRWMVKDDANLISIREHLLDLISKYEKIHWSDDNVTDVQINESNDAEKQIDKEIKFYFKRKTRIQKALKEYGLNQNNLASVLGHNKNYMSELINGLRPFSLNDLIIIHKTFNISLDILIPTFIKPELKKDLAERFKSLQSKVDLMLQFKD